MIGSTGSTGREIVSEALARGNSVSALARDPARLELEDPNLRIVAGDVLDPATLSAAILGQDAVISALGSTYTRKPTTLVSSGTRNVIEAMKGAGVRRLVCITGFGTGDSWGKGNPLTAKVVFPLLLRELYRDKTRQEDEVRQSGLDWVIVRPARLTDKPAKGRYRTGSDMSALKPKSVSRADVAAFCVQQVTDDANLGRTVAISD